MGAPGRVVVVAGQCLPCLLRCVALWLKCNVACAGIVGVVMSLFGCSLVWLRVCLLRHRFCTVDSSQRFAAHLSPCIRLCLWRVAAFSLRRWLPCAAAAATQWGQLLVCCRARPWKFPTLARKQRRQALSWNVWGRRRSASRGSVSWIPLPAGHLTCANPIIPHRARHLLSMWVRCKAGRGSIVHPVIRMLALAQVRPGVFQGCLLLQRRAGRHCVWQIGRV